MKCSRLGTYIVKDAKAVCNECKYFKVKKPSITGKDQHQYMCTHPSAVTVDIVTGKASLDTAHSMRHDQALCGIEARFFDKENELVLNIKRWIDVDDMVYYLRKTFTFSLQFAVAFFMFKTVITPFL